MSSVLTILIIAAALVLGLALAYIPMRLLLTTMARHVRQFIQRQRDRRTQSRETPDRRKAPDPFS
ncbi:MAG TPA: hypothetical protein VJ276_24960 [Thermoanaerobaculia bacterium]|nr:hypothetical protein [Thermoanaerobaculia bacterium]